MQSSMLDVAVVGGGISGVYAAWRLVTEGGKRRVTVFEASDHIGGRLLSVTAPGIPHMQADLGGQRILPALQPRIRELIRVLNQEAAPSEETIETFPFPVDEPENITYLRGFHLRFAELEAPPAWVPYWLASSERGKSPGEILLDAIEQIIPGITSEDLDEAARRALARQAIFAGRPLYEQGFWQVLLRVISNEAYQLAVAAGGYQISNWNAAAAIPGYLTDFGIEPTYAGFRQGFQQVPLTVARRLERAGGEIRLDTPVAGFEWKNGVVELTLWSGEVVRAKALILAMPHRSLELITGHSPLLQRDHIARMVKSVTPRPLFKLFTTYDSPWWRAVGVEIGRSTTDLPVRQTCYWPSADGSPVTAGPAMLMASYSDGLDVGFWDAFRPQRGCGGRTGMPPAPKDHGRWHEYRAPRVMVAEAQRQLALIHGLPFVPDVRHACFRDWGDDPFGGGWNSWNIGVKSWQVSRDIIQPAPAVPVYICGEAYSTHQSWVEGALQTADMVLTRFGITPLANQQTP